MIRYGNFLTGHKMTAGAMAVWVDDGEVLLVRSKHGEQRWGFPAGVIKKHEDPVDGARRELLEETGLTCAAADLEIVGVHVQEHGRHLDCIFRVTAPRPEGSGPLESGDQFEIAEVRWWPVTELPQLRYEAERARARYPDLLAGR